MMPNSVPTLTLHIPPSDMPGVLSRLTTHLIQQYDAFLQTFHNEQQTEFEIFHQQGQPVVRLTLQATESVSSIVIATAPPSEPTCTADTTPLIQRLLEVCVSSYDGPSS